jgi:hypothetical protein
VSFEVSIYFENHKTIRPVTARQLDKDATNQISKTTKKLKLFVFKTLSNIFMSFKRRYKIQKIMKVRIIIV